MGAKVVQAFI